MTEKNTVERSCLNCKGYAMCHIRRTSTMAKELIIKNIIAANIETGISDRLLVDIKARLDYITNDLMGRRCKNYMKG